MRSPIGLAAKVGLGFGSGVGISLPPFLTKGIDGAARALDGIRSLSGGGVKKPAAA